MPELPEVETVRLGLIPAVEGRRLTRVQARRADLRIAFPSGFVERLTGCSVARIRRRAKYLLLDLDSGETLVVHLGMSGRLTIHGAQAPVKPGRFHHKAAEDGSGEGKHYHVVFETEEGTRIVFTDHRRFGLMALTETSGLEHDKLFEGLGPEPLDNAFTPLVLSAKLKGKRTPIKAALLDQRVVAGLGNIYVCEALFRARVSPLRSAHTIPGARATRLVPAIKNTLTEAIAAGGSSLRDYVQPDGELGYFQHAWKAYGREGEPCERCPGPPVCAGLRRLIQAGRGTFYCPRTQR